MAGMADEQSFKAMDLMVWFSALCEDSHKKDYAQFSIM